MSSLNASPASLRLAVFTVLLFIHPLIAQAEINVISSFVDLGSNACIGGTLCDPQDGDQPSLVGSVNVNRSSSTSSSDGWATGFAEIVTEFSVNASTGALDFSGNISGNATAESIVTTVGAAGLGEVTAQASIEITETYTFTVSGTISIIDATAISSDENSCEVEISGSDSEGFNAFLQGEGSKALVGSGTLAPGSYTIRVFLNSLSDRAGPIPIDPRAITVRVRSTSPST